MIIYIVIDLLGCQLLFLRTLLLISRLTILRYDKAKAQIK